MKVGDLVRYAYDETSAPQLGLVTAVDGETIWWTDTAGRESWNHIACLEIINESR
jgi:hypothetical protein